MSDRNGQDNNIDELLKRLNKMYSSDQAGGKPSKKQEETGSGEMDPELRRMLEQAITDGTPETRQAPVSAPGGISESPEDEPAGTPEAPEDEPAARAEQAIRADILKQLGETGGADAETIKVSGTEDPAEAEPLTDAGESADAEESARAKESAIESAEVQKLAGTEFPAEAEVPGNAEVPTEMREPAEKEAPTEPEASVESGEPEETEATEETEVPAIAEVHTETEAPVNIDFPAACIAGNAGEVAAPVSDDVTRSVGSAGAAVSPAGRGAEQAEEHAGNSGEMSSAEPEKTLRDTLISEDFSKRERAAELAPWEEAPAFAEPAGESAVSSIPADAEESAESHAEEPAVTPADEDNAAEALAEAGEQFAEDEEFFTEIPAGEENISSAFEPEPPIEEPILSAEIPAGEQAIPADEEESAESHAEEPAVTPADVENAAEALTEAGEQFAEDEESFAEISAGEENISSVPGQEPSIEEPILSAEIPAGEQAIPADEKESAESHAEGPAVTPADEDNVAEALAEAGEQSAEDEGFFAEIPAGEKNTSSVPEPEPSIEEPILSAEIPAGEQAIPADEKESAESHAEGPAVTPADTEVPVESHAEEPAAPLADTEVLVESHAEEPAVTFADEDNAAEALTEAGEQFAEDEESFAEISAGEENISSVPGQEPSIEEPILSAEIPAGEQAIPADEEESAESHAEEPAVPPADEDNAAEAGEQSAEDKGFFAEIPAGEENISSVPGQEPSIEEPILSAEIPAGEQAIPADEKESAESHAEEPAVTFAGTEKPAESPESGEVSAVGHAGASGKQIPSFEEAAKQAAKETQSGTAETVAAAQNAAGTEGGTVPGTENKPPKTAESRKAVPAGLPPEFRDGRILTDGDIRTLLDLGYEKELAEFIGFERIDLVRREGTGVSTPPGARKKKKKRKPQKSAKPIGNLAEYTDRDQNYEVRARFTERRRHLYIRFAGTLLFAVLLFIYDMPHLFGIPGFGALNPDSAPGLYAFFGLQILLLSAVLSFRQMWRGIKRAAAFEADLYFMPIVLILFNMAYDVLLLSLGGDASPDLFHFVTVLYLLFAIGGEILLLGREEMTFDTVSEEGDRYTLEHTGYNEKDGNIYHVRKTGFLSGTFARIRTETPLRAISIFSFAAILFSLLMAAGEFILTGDLVKVFSAFMKSLALCLPLSSTAAFTLPQFFMTKELHKHGCAVVGDASVEEYAGEKTVIFREEDIFRAGSRVGFSAAGKKKLADQFRLCGALFRKIGGTLSSVLDLSLANAADKEQVVFGEIGEDGLTATVGETDAVIGSAAYLSARGIRIPPESAERAYLRKSDCVPLYIAFDGEVCLILEMTYRIGEATEQMIHELNETGTHIGVSVADPCLTAPFVWRLRRLEPDRIKLCRVTHILGDESFRSIDGGVSAKRAKDLILPLVACRRMYLSRRTVTGILGVFSGVSALFVTALLFTGAIGYFAPAAIALYQLVWFVPMLLASGSHLNREGK